MGFTEPSPKGRTIEHVEGIPADIIARGEEITELGRQMRESADLLDSIANRSLGDGSQKGKAIEQLRESVGDSYKTLRESGDLYEPVGPVLTRYGDQLDIYQPLINDSADECVDLYVAYAQTPGDKDGSLSTEEGGFLGIGGTDEEAAADNRANHRAYEAWKDEAERFDSYYDSWESAFDEAASGIGDEMSGAIEDSVWSDIVDVLKVVGTIVAIAALFTGIGALVWLAVGIGVALTAATAFQMANGEANWTDLALASLTIFPVTKLGSGAALGSGFALGGARGGARAFVKAIRPPGGGVPQLLRISDNGIIGAWRSGGMSSVGRLLGTGNARGMAGYMDEAMVATGRVPTTVWQSSQLYKFSGARAGAGGVGNLNSFNSWAGDLGVPNFKVTPWAGLVV